MDNAIQTAASMFQNLKQNVGNAFSNLGNTTQNVEQNIGQDFSNLGNTLNSYQPIQQLRQDISTPPPDFGTSIQQAAQGALENLPALGPMGGAAAEGFSFGRAALMGTGLLGLQKVAGASNQDILNPGNLGMAYIGGGLKFEGGEPMKIGFKPEDLVPQKDGLLSLGDITGIEREASKTFEGLFPKIEQNRTSYNDPAYMAKTLLPEKDWNTFLDNHPEINNHGDKYADLEKGTDALRDMNGYLGYISTDRGTIPLDDQQRAAVIDNKVASQWTANNGDQEFAIVRRNPDMPTAYDVIDRHHGIPAARAVGLDKVPAIILHKDAPLLSDVYDALKKGEVAPVDIKGGFPLDEQATNQKALQVPIGGEAALTPAQIKELAPEYATDKGKAKVQGVLDKATKAQPVLDESFQQIAQDVGLDPQKDFESRVKAPDTVVQKIAQHRLEGTEEYSLQGVNDAYGARFIVDTPQQKGQIISKINEMDRNGDLKIEKQQQVTKDTYSAYHIDFTKNGVHGEIQIHDPNSYLESVVNHEIRAQVGEKPPTPLQAEKQANAQASQQMPPEAAQVLAQGIEKARAEGKSSIERIEQNNLGQRPLGAQYPSGEEPLVDAKTIARQARLSRFSIMQQVNERAKVLAQSADSTLKGKENNLFRTATEHPEQIDTLATQSSNPQGFKQLLGQYSNFTDYILNTAKGANIPLNEIKDYYTHILDLSDLTEKQRFNDYVDAKTSNYKSGFTRERIFSNIEELQQAGFKLKNDKVSQDILEYIKSINKQIGASTFANTINKFGPGGAVTFKNEAAVPRNFQGQSYQQSNIPGLEGTFIDPEIQKNLDYYNKSALADNFLVSAFDKANTFTKEVRLGGGLFHAFRESINYVGQQLASGRLPRLDKGVLAFISPNSWRGMNQDFINRGVVDKASNMGIQLSNIPDIGSMEATTLNTLNKANPINLVKNATFDRLMNFFKLDTVDKLPGDKQTPEMGRQVNALYNGLNSEVEGINKTVNQFARAIFLAPQFNIGKLVNIKEATLGGFTPEATFARQALIGTVLSTAIAAEVTRRVLTGNFSPDLKSFFANSIANPQFPLPYQSPTGKKLVAQLPGTDISDIIRAIQDPSHAITSRFSTGISLVNQLISGKDYYGNPNTPGGVAQSLLPIPGYQIAQAAKGKESPTTAILNTAGLRVKTDPNDPTMQYFNGLKTARDSLDKNNQAAFDVLHPQAKDANGNRIVDKTSYTKPTQFASLLDSLQGNGKLFTAEQKFQQSQPNHHPMWDLPPNQLKAYLQEQLINGVDPGGDKATVRALKSILPQGFQEQVSQYYRDLTASGVQLATNPNVAQLPQAPDSIQGWQQLKDQGQRTSGYLQQHPELLQYFQSLSNYTNAQRSDMGLPLLAQQTTGGFRGGMGMGRLSIRGGGRGLMKTVAPKTAGGKMLAGTTFGKGKMLGKMTQVKTPAPVKVKAAGKVKGLTTKVSAANIKQLRPQTFKLPPLQRINLKRLGGGYHSPRYGKYGYP